MGHGDSTLGRQLITNYLNLLKAEKQPPKFIAFYNSGVKLLCAEGEILEHCKELETKGVKLMACKTCLHHFGMADKLKTGIMATMVDIMELQKMADKVITL